MDYAHRSGSAQAAEEYARLYGAAAGSAPQRYRAMMEAFAQYYGEAPFRIFSAPGRIEIGGNHTDHNAGRVLAAAISLDTAACCRANGTQTVRLRSEGYPDEFIVDLTSLAPDPAERETTTALIRGVAAGFAETGRPIGGFDAYVTSTVLKGSGLSSSAAFEVLIAAILDGLFGDGAMDPVERARIAQRAENDFFGKPCGLMDQSASSVGGLVTIDFADPARAIVKRISFDFASTGYQPVVVDTGGDHTGLTREYASIRSEMEQVAAQFGARVLRHVDEQEFFRRLPDVARRTSHRAVLRALHFFSDNKRVADQAAALTAGDVEAFLELVIASGESSWKWLQNCYVGGETSQGIPLALAVSERILRVRGAWRVHGGGFAGTILAFVPSQALDEYLSAMDDLFGPGAAIALSIRGCGATEVRL